MPDRVLGRLLQTRRPYTLLILLCLLLWLPGFFTLPPTDRDESRFVQATKQMLESGDYVSIRNGTVARNQKPIGIYWMQLPFAAIARATGIADANPVWPYRIPSLLGGIIAVCATFRLGENLVGRRAGLLGALLLAGSMLLETETHIGKTDAALLAATTLAMAQLARAYASPAMLSRHGWIGFWLAMGVGILLKGPITPLVTGLAVGSLVVADAWSARRRPGWLLALQPQLGVLLMLLVVLPWFVAIAWRSGGEFFRQSVGGDLAGKLAGGDDAHGAPPGTHLLLLSFNLFPSGWLALAALPAAWRARRLPAIRFLLAWLIPCWLLFEAVPTKLPHYPLPLYPALCLLAAAWALEPLASPVWLRRAAIGLTVAAGAVVGLSAAALPWVVGAAADQKLLGVPALLACGLIVWALRAGGFAAALLATPLLIWSLPGLELPSLRVLWVAPLAREALRTHWPQGIRLASAGFAEPSLMFLCGTETTILPNGGAAAEFLAGGADRAVLVDSHMLADFEAKAAAIGSAPKRVAGVDGYNYSRGRRVQLSIWSDKPPKN